MAIWHLAWAVAVSVMGGVLAWQGALAAGPEAAALGSIGAAALFGCVAALSGGEIAGVVAILAWAAAG
ncbi:MAG: hypothetical protein ACREEG_11845, partial [Phenylobacterium sp.]